MKKHLLIAIGIVLLVVLGPLLVREYMKQRPAPYCDPDPTECG